MTYFCCNFVQNKATGKNIWLYLQSSNMYHHLNIAQNMSPLHFHNFYHYKAIILTKENNTIYQKSFIPEFLTTNTFIIILRERFAFSAVNTRIICTTSFDEGTFLNIRSLQNIFKVRKISKTMFLDFNSSKKLTEMFSLILT